MIPGTSRSRLLAFSSAGVLWLAGTSLGLGVSWVVVLPAAAYVLLGSVALASTARRSARTATLLWAVAVVLVALAAGPVGVRDVAGVKLMARAVEGVEIKDLKSLVDQGKKELGSGVVALIATSEDGKASVVVGVTPDLVARFSAVDLVRKASEVLGGKGGGGKPDMAQAGGPDGDKADAALAAIEAAMDAA